MIAAARKAKRVVQVGLQRRSGPLYRKVVERVQNGAIGRVLYARSWYYANGPRSATASRLRRRRGSTTICGKARRRSGRIRTTSSITTGISSGTGATASSATTACTRSTFAAGRWASIIRRRSRPAGAKLRYDDDQETPDTCTATFDCDGRTIVWEGISWSPRLQPTSPIGMEFRGENGTMYVDDDGYTIYDPQRKVWKATSSARRRGAPHNFLDAIRNGPRPMRTSKKATRARCSATWATSRIARDRRSRSIRRTVISSTIRPPNLPRLPVSQRLGSRRVMRFGVPLLAAYRVAPPRRSALLAVKQSLAVGGKQCRARSWQPISPPRAVAHHDSWDSLTRSSGAGRAGTKAVGLVIVDEHFLLGIELEFAVEDP